MLPIRALAALRALFVAGFLAGPGAAHATLFQVDWTATLVGDPAVCNETECYSFPAGDGSASGSFGVFDVQYVGQEFALPTDGSVTITFGGTQKLGEWGGSYALDGTASTGFRFTSLSPAAGHTTNLSNPGDSVFLNAVIRNIPDVNLIQIFYAASGDSGTVRFLFLDQFQAISYSSTGTVQLAYTLVPEPRLLTVAAIGLVLAAYRTRSGARAAPARSRA